MPRPAPQVARAGDAASVSSQCEGCHDEIAREWRSSMHAQADTDPVYRRALAIEPLPFCRGCHAPEADPRTDASPRLSALGIGCVTCHVTAPGPDAPTLASPGKALIAPHAIRRDASFATAAACASCHEFNFPTQAPGAPAERMQSTVSEHAASAFHDTPCSSCHMPSIASRAGGSHRNHDFASTRVPAMLRAAVNVTAERTDSSRVRLVLTPGAVGHAFPTGDLFRRLVVTAEAVDGDWTVWSDSSRSLQRRFELRPVGPGYSTRHMVGDDRVGARDVAPVVLDLGEAARGRTIAWRIEYQRVEHPVRADGSGAVVADAIVVAEGLLPAAGTAR